MLRRALLTLATLATVGMGGCDLLGIEGATVLAERRAAEGKAVGGACRQAGRAIEDCYVLNKKADKAAVYAGWREMDDYMRENKLEAVAPQLQAEAKAKPSGNDAADEEPEAKPSGKDTKEARASAKKAEAH